MTKKFKYTGATAQAINAAGYWYGGGNNGKRGFNGYGPLGGPAAGNVFGCAQQFEVHAPLTLSELCVHALIGPGVGSTTFSYKLYLNTSMKNGHPVPDNNSLVLTSDPITYSKSEQENIHSSTMHSPEKVVAFEYSLKPGKYWLAEEGDPGGPSIYVNYSYIPEGHLTTH